MTGRHSDLRDLKHVVILMQENRSFDHYFGSLRGVRGFGDRSTTPHDGEYYVSQVLAALQADPDVFNSTLVIITYDENDGQFDHVPPPVPAQGTPDEFHLELPVGLGTGCRCC
jgi:phospholipase C